MEQNKKSDIQRIVDLLEVNDFHVFKAEEEAGDMFTARINRAGTILLRVAPLTRRKAES
jgi:hypothetical protein